MLNVYAIWWWDIVGDAGWGKPHKKPMPCVSVGFIIEWPNDDQEVRCYRVVDTQSGKGPGGWQVIPEGCIDQVSYLGQVEAGFKVK